MCGNGQAWHSFFTFPVNNGMEIKRNEATFNRPEGDRVLDAPYVFVDIPAFIDQLKSEKAWEKSDRNGITVYKSESLTIVVSALQASASLPDNDVDESLTIQVLHGNVRVTTPDGDIDMKERHMITFHPGIVHSVQAITHAILLITTNKDSR